jgi:DNA modification methylase
MNFEKISVGELKSASYNPRKDLKPGDAEYEKLKRSIQEFGYVEPVIWNKRTGTVVGGHQRIKVMKDLGYEEVDCVVVDLDEQKEKALNIALNKISGEWDEGLLATLLKDLDNNGYDITFTGFDLAEAQELFGSGSFENVHEDEFDVESAAAEIVEPKTRRGDLWLIGKHRLLCGDCTLDNDVAKLMDGRAADVMVTDPPYNVDYGSAIIGKNKSKTRAESSIANDNMSDDDFYQFLLAFYKAAYGVMKKGAPLYVFHSTKETVNFTRAMEEAGFKYAQTLVWLKNHFTLGRQDYQWIHEPILYGWKEGAGHYFIGDRNLPTVFEEFKENPNKLNKAELVELLTKILDIPTTVIKDNKPSRSEDHPTMKPITLCAKLIYNSSHEDDTVFEPFGGSGSTLIAAEQLNRRCCAIELEPKYCDVIVRRYKELCPEIEVKHIRDGQEVFD